MNDKPQCVELQSRMVEYFSGPPGQVPEEIQKHLTTCQVCRQEFDQLEQTLAHLQKSSAVPEVVPAHLLIAIEARLDTTPQLKPVPRQMNQTRTLLIVQYSYLACMSVVIWLSILLVQPSLNGWLLEYGLVSNIELVNDYGLFLAFFAAGGIFALISSPLLLKNLNRNPMREPKSGFLARLFSGSLRMFAC